MNSKFDSTAANGSLHRFLTRTALHLVCAGVFGFHSNLEGQEFHLATMEKRIRTYRQLLLGDVSFSTKSSYALNGSGTWETLDQSENLFQSSGESQSCYRGKDLHLLTLNQSYFFDVRHLGENTYGLESVAPKNEYKYVFGLPVLREFTVYFSGLLVEGVEIDKLFRSGGISISDANSTNTEPNTFVVSFDFGNGSYEVDEFNRIHRGKVSFLPDGYWAIARYEIELASILNLAGVRNNGEAKKWAQPAIVVREIEYHQLRPFPVPKRVLTTYDCPAPYKDRRYEDRLDDYRFEKPKDEVFYLSSYGWPEPPFSDKSSGWIGWILGGIVGVALVGGAVYYHRRTGK